MGWMAPLKGAPVGAYRCGGLGTAGPPPQASPRLLSCRPSSGRGPRPVHDETTGNRWRPTPRRRRALEGARRHARTNFRKAWTDSERIVHLRHARDLMDLRFADPLDLDQMAAQAGYFQVPLRTFLQGCLRRDAGELPDPAEGGTGQRPVEPLRRYPRTASGGSPPTFSATRRSRAKAGYSALNPPTQAGRRVGRPGRRRTRARSLRSPAPRRPRRAGRRSGTSCR